MRHSSKFSPLAFFSALNPKIISNSKKQRQFGARSSSSRPSGSGDTILYFFLTHECRHKKKGKCICYYYMYSMQYMQYIMNHGYTLSIRHEHTTWYQYIHMYVFVQMTFIYGMSFFIFYVGPSSWVIEKNYILDHFQLLDQMYEKMNECWKVTL